MQDKVAASWFNWMTKWSTTAELMILQKCLEEYYVQRARLAMLGENTTYISTGIEIMESELVRRDIHT